MSVWPNYDMSICLPSSSNLEYSAAPFNFAHWILAHVYPTILQLRKVVPRWTGSQRVAVHMVVDDSNELLSGWLAHYNEIMFPWHVFMTPDLSSGQRCDATIEVNVPYRAFCRPSFFDGAHVFTSFVRTRALYTSTKSTSLETLKRNVFVLVRQPVTNVVRPAWEVVGLSEVCAEFIQRQDAGTWRVSCGSFYRELFLTAAVQVLKFTDALIGSTGAGLANLIFMRPGTRLLELDAFEHHTFHVFMFQQLAVQAGLFPEKVWLDEHGVRHFLSSTDVKNCSTDTFPRKPYISTARITNEQFELLIASLRGTSSILD